MCKDNPGLLVKAFFFSSSQVSEFPFNSRYGFKREAERSRAESDPSDEPLHLMHDEEP